MNSVVIIKYGLIPTLTPWKYIHNIYIIITKKDKLKYNIFSFSKLYNIIFLNSIYNIIFLNFIYDIIKINNIFLINIYNIYIYIIFFR